jgi:hypothetical protein
MADQSKPAPVFVYYFAYCSIPAAEVDQIVAGQKDNLSVWAEKAYRQGEDLVARLRPAPSLGLAAEVDLELGEPGHRNGSVFLPLRWTARRPYRLFPEMTAELVIDPFGADASQLTFRGTYRPPLGAIGRALDRALMHRVAERIVKSFVDDLVELVEYVGHLGSGSEM